MDLSWEARFLALRADVAADEQRAQEMADATADRRHADRLGGKAEYAARFLARMDELAGERSPQA